MQLRSVWGRLARSKDAASVQRAARAGSGESWAASERRGRASMKLSSCCRRRCCRRRYFFVFLSVFLSCLLTAEDDVVYGNYILYISHPRFFSIQSVKSIHHIKKLSRDVYFSRDHLARKFFWLQKKKIKIKKDEKKTKKTTRKKQKKAIDSLDTSDKLANRHLCCGLGLLHSTSCLAARFQLAN